MIYAYIAVMAVTTYLIRMLPLTLFQKKIRNRYLRSFLYYVPYACLAAMTFPAILYSSGSVISAAAGFLTAVLLSPLARRFLLWNAFWPWQPGSRFFRRSRDQKY